MRADCSHLAPFRVLGGPQGSSTSDGMNGLFRVSAGRLFEGCRALQIIASDGAGWDHVSVTLPGVLDTPSWSEMEAVRLLFFDPSETVVQLHVPVSEHVNIHPGCLHLWRKQDAEHPLPPLECV